MGKFDAKVVIVTGASSGIGKAIAIAFAQEGANLTITGRNKDRLSSVGDTCRDTGAKVVEVVCDLADFQTLEPIIDRTVEIFGAIDVLVNNAGIGLLGPVEKLQLEDYERIMQVNLRSVIFLCKYALPHLRKTQGCIVNNSSCVSKTSFPMCVLYCAVKAAVDHFTRGFASECTADRVRVNCINPGFVESEIFRNILPEKVADETRDQFVKNQPFGLLQGDEIARAVMYLCEAKGVTGTTLVVDGGFLLQ